MDVKTIGASGQISFGKQHAGRTVTVEEIEAGVWLVKAVRVIPENEVWLHQPATKQALDRAVEWAERNEPEPANLARLARQLRKRR